MQATNTVLIFCCTLAVVVHPSALAADWAAPDVKLPDPLAHPLIACTGEELARLREAWKGEGAAHDVVAKLIAEADKALKDPLDFPARGGQHNQWYQCEKCQRGLLTIDATHHKCPGCGTVYTGAPFDDVIFEKVHNNNLHRMRVSAWAYAITTDTKYSDFAAKVLLGYAERYEAYPFHDNAQKTGKSGGHLFEQTLNEAYSMALDIGPAFDLVFPALNDEQRKTIREKFLKPMLANIANNSAGKSNWQSWHNTAFVWGGACLDDVAWIKRAIDDPTNGFLFQMKASVTGDGMWYENSWGYHFYTLDALVKTAEAARRLKLDLWGDPPFKKMFTLPLEYTMADGSLPRFGDDVNSTAHGSGGLFEPAYLAYNDDALLPLLDDKPNFDSILLGRKLGAHAAMPVLKSCVFKDAGHAILRTHGPAEMSAAFVFGPFGGFHGHFDKLSFVLFGFGQELGVDPGRAKSQAYRLPIHHNWYRATIAHNAVVVDKKSQEGAGGELDCFASNEQFALAMAHCDKAYKGISQSRLMLATPEYVLVFDNLTAEDQKEHRFDWCYHNRGKSVACDVVKDASPLSDEQGMEFIKNLKSGKSHALTRVTFSGEKVTTNLLMDAQAGTEVWTGDGVGASVDERVPLALVTRTGKSARFAAILEPAAAGQPPQIENVAISENNGAQTITISGKSGKDEVIVSGKSVEVRRDGNAVLKSE